MAHQASPIDIGPGDKRYSPTSPHNQTSNLTSALKQAAPGASPRAQNGFRSNNIDIKPSAARKDSLAVPFGNSSSGARPISVSSRHRRESGPGSFMGNMSWGPMSFGSFLQDDIMMGGVSPSVKPSSFHSSSYLPKMEANFWANLKCCDTLFAGLHELCAHFETVHKQAPSQFPYTNDRTPRRKSSGTNHGDWNGQNHTRGFQPWSENRLNGLPSSKFGHPLPDSVRKPSTVGMQDMDTIGEMELDDDPTTAGFGQFQQGQDGYSSESTPQMGTAVPNGMVNGHGAPSNGSSPPQQMQGYGNGMYPSMGQQGNGQQFDQSRNFGQQTNGNYRPLSNANAVPFNTQMFDKLSSNFRNLDFGSNNDMRDLCINEPAKNLYSDDGTFNSLQYPQFNFNGNGLGEAGGDVTTNNDENAKKLQAQRLAAGVGKQPSEEERPFKCPVIGCEKAYKNANGLRYHEKHGHSSQKLKENGDGTFSIVDPVTSIPYPGTVGMEKEKPYRCEVCGKRYKNLNGLKYHRNHSPPCNPEFSMNQMPGLHGEVDGEDSAVY